VVGLVTGGCLCVIRALALEAGVLVTRAAVAVTFARTTPRHRRCRRRRESGRGRGGRGQQRGRGRGGGGVTEIPGLALVASAARRVIGAQNAERFRLHLRAVLQPCRDLGNARTSRFNSSVRDLG
jgi:hypothetical protein